MKSIDIVCPIYKNIDQVKRLYSLIQKQKDVDINRIVFPVTLCEDERINNEMHSFCTEHGILFFNETKEIFSHSLTREKAIREYCASDIVILLSQDVILREEHALFNLAKSLQGDVVYAYGRQVSTYNNIEKYIRRKNYPLQSITIDESMVDQMQLMAFFASDAFSALDRPKFLEIGGYRGFNVMMSEDMLYAKFVLDSGYKKAYVADAVVEHSHKYTLKQLYTRYYQTGIFYQKVGLFDGYKKTNSGMKLALYVLKEALKHFDIPVLLRWLPDMAVRYLGMKNGEKHKVK